MARTWRIVFRGPVDPDSRVMRTQGTPPRQASNAQTAVNERQIIAAAEVTVDAPDFGHLEPMLDTALAQLARHRVIDQPGVVLADAGYWHTRQIQAISERGVDVLRAGARPVPRRPRRLRRIWRMYDRQRRRLRCPMAP